MNSISSAFGAVIGCVLLALSGNLVFTYEPLIKAFKGGASSNELTIILYIASGVAGGIYLVVQSALNFEETGNPVEQQPFMW